MLLMKTIIFLIVMPGITLGYIPLKIVTSPHHLSFHTGLTPYLAPLFWGAGAFVSLWCVRDFLSKGKGTPSPMDPPKKLVITRPYQYCRNPMYVGILTVLLGHIAWFESLPLILYSTGLFGIFNIFVIFYEEPHLMKVFGESYRQYKARVPRWIPRRYRPNET